MWIMCLYFHRLLTDFLPGATFLQGVKCQQLAIQSLVLAMVGLSVCPSVRHTMALSQNNASYDHEIFTDG